MRLSSNGYDREGPGNHLFIRFKKNPACRISGIFKLLKTRYPDIEIVGGDVLPLKGAVT
jgi:hypothetical protein